MRMTRMRANIANDDANKSKLKTFLQRRILL